MSDPKGYQIVHNVEDDVTVVISTTKMELGRLAISIGWALQQSLRKNLPNFDPLTLMQPTQRKHTVSVLQRMGLIDHWKTQALLLRTITQIWDQNPIQTTLDDRDKVGVFDALRFFQQVYDLVGDEMRAQNGRHFGSNVTRVQFDEFVPGAKV